LSLLRGGLISWDCEDGVTGMGLGSTSVRSILRCCVQGR
jgi:hypothetical protein